MQNISEETIVEAAKGDIGAFEDLYNATCSFVYNVIYGMTRSREDTEEVTQDVFLKIYKNLKRFQLRSSFRTWVYRISVNTAINYLKRRAREQGRMISYNDAIKVNTPLQTPSQVNEERVSSLLGALNPDQRACIVLRNIEGLSYKEIAKTLHININTVRTRLRRARQALLAQF